ncbi:helix-turn-helix domain-containing protein [Phytomonospora sp. NPDC050363]|uniref:helix-turn-helix domain-containing protein n=1 Tax=Phytomonospora sp. NPDC050363 TaxID=3155642 RepID=UPI0033D41C4D
MSAKVATRARVVLWPGQGRTRVDVAGLAGVSLPTVDRWKARFVCEGAAGLIGRKPGAGRVQSRRRVGRGSWRSPGPRAGLDGVDALVEPGPCRLVAP